MTSHPDSFNDSDAENRHGMENKIALTHVTHRSMATEFVVILPPHAPNEAVDVALEALEGLDAIEAALTVYSPASEVSQINLFAGKKPIVVSRSTFEVIQRAILWAQRTGGACDITTGPLVELWGFHGRNQAACSQPQQEPTGTKPSDADIQETRSLVGFEKIHLDSAQQSVFLEKPRMKLTLGSIGKGDALDRLAAEMRDCEIHDFLIHGGNSSVIAAGNESPDDPRGWRIGLSHPTKPNRTLGAVWVKDSAMGTSGSGKQFFHHRGKRYSHVIDPRTGYPESDLLSVSVLTPSAADADAAATGMFVMGSQAVAAIINDKPEWLPDLITTAPGKRQDEVVIKSHGDAWDFGE